MALKSPRDWTKFFYDLHSLMNKFLGSPVRADTKQSELDQAVYNFYGPVEPDGQHTVVRVEITVSREEAIPIWVQPSFWEKTE